MLSKSSVSQTVTLPDGRTFGYATYGPQPSPDIPTIVYCHGFPGSRIEAAFFDSKQMPLHVISIDRPGMGLSTFQSSRRILDWPADVLALLNHLRIPQFYVLGDSGGSPYALACAKEIPQERLLGISVVSGIYPLSLGMQGMSFGVQALMVAGTWLPSSVMAKLLDWEFGNVANQKDRKTFEKAFMKGMEGKSERDIRCLDDLEFRLIVIESMREAFRQGSGGPAWELGLYGRWGFEIEELDGKRITLWHGKKDINTPFLMAEKAAKVLKGCELKVFEEESHLSLPYNYIEEIIGNMLNS
jgi:pimeloyl-ACP methyl ester carboxylesterase